MAGRLYSTENRDIRHKEILLTSITGKLPPFLETGTIPLWPNNAGVLVREQQNSKLKKIYEKVKRSLKNLIRTGAGTGGGFFTGNMVKNGVVSYVKT